MTGFLEATPELLVLLPLAIAAGLDLYLTLLFLGAAPTTPWWDQPLPGALNDLDSLSVLIVVGTFYVLEFAAERFPAAALFWNAFHAVIRPVSGALLALLVLDGQAPEVVATGALAAGAVASLSHAVRSGDAILRWLSAVPTLHPVLASAAEDVAVLALVVLALDQPLWALAAATAAAVVCVGIGPSRVRAFVFAIRLATGRVFQALGAPRWSDTEGIPSWVRGALRGDVMAPGGGLRGARSAADRLMGAPRFATGWVVVTGDAPVFVFRVRRRVRAVDLDLHRATQVSESAFFRRVELETKSGRRTSLFFGLGGPSTESLRAEFLYG